MSRSTSSRGDLAITRPFQAADQNGPLCMCPFTHAASACKATIWRYGQFRLLTHSLVIAVRISRAVRIALCRQALLREPAARGSGPPDSLAEGAVAGGWRVSRVGCRYSRRAGVILASCRVHVAHTKFHKPHVRAAVSTDFPRAAGRCLAGVDVRDRLAVCLVNVLFNIFRAVICLASAKDACRTRCDRRGQRPSCRDQDV